MGLLVALAPAGCAATEDTTSVPRDSTGSDDPIRIREKARAFLVGTDLEETGFGLYSYLLFGSPPSESSRDRYIAGAGGNIAIVVDATNDTGNSQFPAGFLVLKETSEVRADGGNQGGKINISAAGFTASQTSLVQAWARQPAGVDGQVGIQALIAGVSESITPLPGNFLDAAALLRARCAQRASGGETSSFIAAGRDGLPPEPGGLLSSSVFDLVPAPRAASRGAGSTVPTWRPSNPARFWYTPTDPSCGWIAGGRR